MQVVSAWRPFYGFYVFRKGNLGIMLVFPFNKSTPKLRTYGLFGKGFWRFSLKRKVLYYMRDSERVFGSTSKNNYGF